MTREEAASQLKITTWAQRNQGNSYLADALEIAIKSLEQEPILDKIRAEIEQLPTKTRTNWDGCCPDIDYPEIEYVDVTKNKLLRIIDRYKSESEVSDADSN